jgi:hexosaminidase
MRLTIGLSILFYSFAAVAQQVNIIPQPVEMKIGKGSFILSPEVSFMLIRSDQDKYDETEKSRQFLISYMKKNYGFWPGSKGKSSSVPDKVILFSINETKNPIGGQYTLTINEGMIEITAHDEEGLFYGTQTLIQLSSRLNM